MKTIIFTSSIVIASLGLVACSSPSEPAPTVTVTQTAPAPPPPSVDDGVVTNQQKYLSFVRQNGGRYASAASDFQLIDMGDTICSGFSRGLSQDQIIEALSRALVSSGMDNEGGAVFGATLIVGAKNYLCPAYA